MAHKFQVNLGGIIELLSNHLYGTPEVYVRELLQNAVDAITARRAREPGAATGAITITVHPERPPRLVIADDGVGLTEAEVHQFLATIGESSKRGDVDRGDLLGQFGIGLLSAFVVSDTIVVETRAAGAPAVTWRGRVDGTYEVAATASDRAVGTTVELVAKRGAEPLFAPARVTELVTRYGGLLPYPIEVVHGATRVVANEERPVFRRAYPDARTRRAAALAYGKQVFGEDFLDAIPLRAEPGDVAGLAFVRRTPASPGGKRADRVYLKGMLLATSAADLVPAWAGFVRCIVDARELRPTASREAFYHDDRLEAAREALTRCLLDHVAGLARTDPETLDALVAVHATWLKAMSLEDDALYRAIVDQLPVQTTVGVTTLGALRRDGAVVRYAATVDGFRQIAHVAAAQGMAIVNAGYIHDAELLARLPAVVPGARVEVVTTEDVVHAFEDASLAELDAAHDLLRAADVALRPFRCATELKRFAPDAMPGLYTASARGTFRRDAEQAAAAAGGLWGSVLSDLVSAHDDRRDDARLVFNQRNPLVQRLIDRGGDRALLHHAVRALFTQALLLGHHPLGAAELAAMNESLVGLVELATLAALPARAKA